MKSLLMTQLICMSFLLASALAHKSGWLATKPAFAVFALALLLAAVLGLVGIGYVALSWVGVVTAVQRGVAALVMGLGMLPLLAITLTLGTGSISLPRIHDISTRPERPLQFVHAQSLRTAAENSLEPPAAKVVDLQRRHYPGIAPILSELAQDQAFQRSIAVARALGWSIAFEDAEAGVIEAIAETRFFGFKDDIVIQVAAAGQGSRVDLRSVSRFGVGDFGANAARIARFTRAFADAQS